MALTKTQKTIVNKLEKLVNKRFNIITLNKELSDIFKEDIKAELLEDNPNELTDWNIIFNSCKDSSFGYFDIYVLKMRNKGYDNSDFYVTEIGYEFE